VKRFAGQSLFAKAEISLCRAGLRFDQQRFQEALNLVNLAIPILRESDDQHRFIEARILRARAFCFTGDTAAADELNDILQDLARKPNKRLEISATSLLATAQALKGKPQLARSTLEEARELAVGFSDLAIQPQLDWVDGLIASAQGDLAAAETLLTSAMDGFHRSGDTGHGAALALDLAILYDSQGRYSEAGRLTAKALRVLRTFKIDREPNSAIALLEKSATQGQSMFDKLLKARAAIQTVFQLPPLPITAV